MKRFKIVKITDKDDIDRTDGRYPTRIGRKAHIHFLEYGYGMVLKYSPDWNGDYKEPYEGFFQTSPVFTIDKTEKNGKENYAIRTKNSIYYLEEV